VPRWALAVRAGGLLVGVVVLAVACALSWVQVHRDAVVQHGPHVVAQVDSTRVTSHSSRSGRVWTTHYRVRFAVAGRTIATTVRASGDDPCACASTLVAYDPGKPTQAELVGAPLGSRTGALLLTAFTVALLGVNLVVIRLLRRLRPSPLPMPLPMPPSALTALPEMSALPTVRSRPRGRNLVVIGVTTVVLVALPLVLVARSGNSGPSLRLEQRVISAALAGQGTTDCLALPPAQPVLRPTTPRWVHEALRAGLDAPVPVGSQGYPHYYPGRSAFGSDLEPTFLKLGGGSAAGLPSTAFGAWLGTSGNDGFRSIDLWALSTPENAARFADVYVAATCYRFARYSGFPVRLTEPRAPTAGARYLLMGDGHTHGLILAMAVAPAGDFVVRTFAYGRPGQEAQLVERAAAGLGHALAAPA
jgi:hypothetical protein